MSPKDTEAIRKMVSHIRSILSYCEGIRSLAEFEANPMRTDAAVFNLMQLGELAKGTLSDEAKGQIKAIPWQQIYGMRNRIVHGYAGVSMQIIWDTIHDDLPELLKEFEGLLSEK